jgi:thioesterase domain-containing protein/acyl carrier protein
LREYLAEKLPDYMVPTVFMVLEALPVTPNGKQDRKSLPAPPLEQERDAENEYIQPRDEVETKLAKIWGNVLNINAIGVKDNFFGIGGNSLQAVTIFSDIQKSFGKSLPLATLLSAPTIEQIANILRNEQENITWSSLVPIQPKGSKPPLFCVHAAAGNVLFYRDLARFLDQNQPLYALQSQGLDGVKPPLKSVKEMAAHYLQEIRTVQTKGPYSLAGYSLGGIIAFEMAQQLQAQGEKVNFLGLLDTAAPKLLRLAKKALPTANSISSHISNLSQLNWNEKIAYMGEKLFLRIERFKSKIRNLFSKIKPTSKESLDGKMRDSVVEETNRQAGRDYEPRVYPGKAVLFRATGQRARYAKEAQLGWDGLVAGGLVVESVPGKHDTITNDGIMNEPNVQILANKLKGYL